jgi:hypothetical protein
VPDEFGNMTAQLANKITGCTDEEMRNTIKMVCKRARQTDNPDEYTRDVLSKLGLWAYAEHLLEQSRGAA